MATATIKKRTGDWFAETESVTLVLTAEEAFAVRDVLNLVFNNGTHGGELINGVWNELLKMNVPRTEIFWIESYGTTPGKSILRFLPGHCQSFAKEESE